MKQLNIKLIVNETENTKANFYVTGFFGQANIDKVFP